MKNVMEIRTSKGTYKCNCGEPRKCPVHSCPCGCKMGIGDKNYMEEHFANEIN